MIGVIIVLSVIVLAQMCMIYGLINRFVRQSGQSGMSAAAVLKQAEKMLIESTPKEDKKPMDHLQRMGRKIGSTGPIEQMPSYMETKK